MQQHDAEKLSDLKHKALLVMQVLALDNLQANLEKSQMLLKKTVSPGLIEEAIDKGEASFDEALEIIEERLRQYPQQ